MFFFKTKLFIPSVFCSFKNSIDFSRTDNVFLQAKIISKTENNAFLKAKMFTVVPATAFFSFKNTHTFQACPLLKFKNTLLFSDPKIDELFRQFNDNYFIRKNKQLILDIFNKFFYYLYKLDTIKKNIYLYRFLKFIKERKVLTETEFNSVFRSFNGE